MTAVPSRGVLEAYLDEAYRWNRSITLTSVPRSQAWRRHVRESLGLLDAVPFHQGACIVDVGSGMGLPGVPLAVVRPDLTVTLLEADRRKAGFLVHVAGLLGLDNIRVMSVRAETAGHAPDSREYFDSAVSRAAAPPAVLWELTLPLVRLGGTVVALVSGDAAQGAETARACGGAPPQAVAPGILTTTKISPTPVAYPRRPGVPRRHRLVR
ncbi:MAG: 16S rRNA (guanine(527)-N(7))-methyltransferase RsmG [Candidatus Dormibacteria bacterium]